MRHLGGLVLVLLVMGAGPGWGWSPAMQESISETGARLAPPDLLRQIAKHRGKLREGTRAAFYDGDESRHYFNGELPGRLGARDVESLKARGQLDRVVLYEVDGAIKAIQALRPFEEVVYRLGVVAHYVADLNHPLNCSAEDAMEPRYFGDFSRYAESAAPRFQPVFYGLRPALQQAETPQQLIDEARERCRKTYPRIGDEYRRIGTIDGRRHFDDRSTAFGVTALAYSHAISDVAEIYRYIWLHSGGRDGRKQLPLRGQTAVAVPKDPATD
ncbi:MAG: hypothetical protein AAGD01_17960 [Acidobacteriota bacterium]